MPTLIDGREVASDSEEWRVETEARYLLSFPDAKKKELLIAREGKRGKVAVGILRQTMINLLRYRSSDE